ncbi:hypothetical protein ACIF8T_27400 [Streptomyces sp. NPDC085946]|uniref:hypothetical protein n=1 Tax=Streptomyces sp. NPDC085946 TaxID=3365744 RepID=UPI0037D02241
MLDFGRALHVNTFETHRLLAAAVRPAAEAGVRPDPNGAGELRAGPARVRAPGIRTVPVFRSAGAVVLNGAQPEEAIERAFEAASAGLRTHMPPTALFLLTLENA